MAPPRVRSQSAGLGSYADRMKTYTAPVRQDRMMKQSMGPGQSMAMSGSPNLASYSERDINALKQATQNLGQPMSVVVPILTEVYLVMTVAVSLLQVCLTHEVI
jgi:hypothetical protein